MRHVFFAVDANMLEPMAVAVYSLLVHVQPSDYTVTVVVMGDDDDVARAHGLLSEVCVGTGLTTVVKRALPTFANCRPTVEYITSSTFIRMEIDRYLPFDAHRVLYVDADVVFTGDPGELFELPLDGYFAAAVHDRWTCSTIPTFNAGVMMINLDQWRMESITEQVLARDLLSKRVSDQTILNILFEGRYLELNGVFNFVPGPAWQITLQEFVQLYMHGRRDVRIIHFAGPDKPWRRGSRVNCLYIYRMYAERRVDLAAQEKLLNIYTRWTEDQNDHVDSHNALIQRNGDDVHGRA